MNIDELTIGQAKQLAEMFCNSRDENSGVALPGMIGKYVIVRSHNEGINAGYLVSAKRGVVVLSQARRLWYHKPAEKTLSWYEGVANTGLSSDSKVSAPVTTKHIVEDYSIIECTRAAADSIQGAKTHGQ